MTYTVKEIFYSLQGEGFHAGRPAVFCRFAGCNLWDGVERHRSRSACRFCDTDFVGAADAGRFATADALAERIASEWPTDADTRFVVLTGGEPLLQVDHDLCDALHAHGFVVAVETNGTIPVPDGVDWVCVSPKSADFKQRSGSEIKVVFPQPWLNMNALATLPFEHRFVQPMDDSRSRENAAMAVEFCLHNPGWRLSLQTHKVLGIR